MRPSILAVLFVLSLFVRAGSTWAAGTAVASNDDIVKEIMEGLIVPSQRDPDKGASQRPKRRANYVETYGVQAMPAFLELARHSDANVRMNALLGISELIHTNPLGPAKLKPLCQQALRVAIEKLQDTDFMVRYAAMGLAGAVYAAQPEEQGRNRVVINHLLGVLFSRESVFEKAGAARTLSPLIGLPIADVTQEEQDKAQAAIADVRKWYEQNRERLGIVALRPAKEVFDDMQSEKAEVRTAALGEIAARQDPSYVGKMCERLHVEKDAAVLQAARNTLRELTGMEIKLKPKDSPDERKKVVAKWLQWYRAQPDLKALAQGGDAKERLAAVAQLMKLDDPRIKVKLVEHLRLGTSDETLTQALAAALTKITGHELKIDPKRDRAQQLRKWETWVETAPLVKAAVEEKDAKKRAALISALNDTKYRHAKLCDALVERVLKEDNADVRLAICLTIEGLFYYAIGARAEMTTGQVKTQVEKFKRDFWDEERKRYE